MSRQSLIAPLAVGTGINELKQLFGPVPCWFYDVYKLKSSSYVSYVGRLLDLWRL